MELHGINWYPGHMAKTKRLITENLKIIDIVAEIMDARIPKSSRNPDFDRLLLEKPRLIILNKSDMADPNISKMWLKHYESLGIKAILADCKSGTGLNNVIPSIKEIIADKLLRRENRGISGISTKIMVVGVPNAGKSSFINRLAGGKRAKVEDRPGVTRGKQWISVGNGFDLLDMPGILWPKIEDPIFSLNLATTGAIKDEITDLEYLASYLLKTLCENYSPLLKVRYKLEDTENKEGFDLLTEVAKKRGFLLSKGAYDTERAAKIVLDEFRGGLLGRITLEKP
jgi:ribosome biogenesis GTPase A